MKLAQVLMEVLYDIEIIASNGNVVSTLTGVSGQQTINNLPSGNYSAQLTFGTAPDVYSTVDYFSVAGGNSVTAALSASQNFVDINNNQPIDFIASSVGATTYNWNFGDGTIINNGPTNISHTFTQAGNYNVTYTATNGICSTSATVAVEVVNTTGIADIAQSGMSIISNGDRLAIQFNKTAGSGTIEMFNMVGQRVYVNEQVLLKGTKQLTFDQLSVGQYIIKVTGRDQVFTQKVYISR
jgi:PKD repeat protein